MEPIRRTTLLAGSLLVLGALTMAWVYLRADADSQTTTRTALPIPRSGLVERIDGSTLTLAGAQGQTFTVSLDEQTVIRHSNGSGAFEPITLAEIQTGQLATLTVELPGSGIVGAIDLVEIGGMQ